MATRTGVQVEKESEEIWRQRAAALERILEHRGEMARRGVLLSKEEIDRIIDETRGRCD